MHFRRRGHLHGESEAGRVLEFGLIVTQIGTAVVFYPVARRPNQTIALGYVAARIMESVIAAIGIMSMLSVVPVASALGGATGSDAAALTNGNSLVHTCEWAFEWGLGLVAGIANGLMVGYLMYKSALVPPRMALLGLIDGSLLIVNFVLILPGLQERRGTFRSTYHSRGRVGVVPWHLLRMEGLPTVELDCPSRGGDGGAPRAMTDSHDEICEPIRIESLR